MPTEASLDIQKLYLEYGKEKVDKEIAKLHYKKNITALPKTVSKEKPILYVFRHGETTDNRDMLFSGWRDCDLTESGIKQAELLAEKMKDLDIDMLISSPQVRAVKTMQIAIAKNACAKNLEIQIDPRLKERNYGDYQGKSKLIARLKNPEIVSSFRRGYDTPPPNGESIAMVAKRTREFLDEILPLMKEHKINVAISCHGNSIRGIRQYFEKLSNDEAAHIETPLAQDYAAYSV